MIVVKKRKSLQRWRYAAQVMSEWLDDLINDGVDAPPPAVSKNLLFSAIRELCDSQNIPAGVVDALEREEIPNSQEMTEFKTEMDKIMKQGDADAYAEFMGGGIDDE